MRSRIDDSYLDQSSYVMDNSDGTDMEFSTINRLMADFNINRDSSVSQKRSPLKMLKITGDSSNEPGTSYQIQRHENSSETSNTFYARIQGKYYRIVQSFISCFRELSCLFRCKMFSPDFGVKFMLFLTKFFFLNFYSKQSMMVPLHLPTSMRTIHSKRLNMYWIVA